MTRRKAQVEGSDKPIPGGRRFTLAADAVAELNPLAKPLDWKFIQSEQLKILGVEAQDGEPFTAEKQARLTQLVAAGATVLAAARAVGVPYPQVFEERRRNGVFASQLEAAREARLDLLEDDLVRRARKSDAALMFLLKTLRPDVYNRPAPKASDDGESGDSAASLASLATSLRGLTDTELETMQKLVAKANRSG